MRGTLRFSGIDAAAESGIKPLRTKDFGERTAGDACAR
jgi:hypothetical protein